MSYPLRLWWKALTHFWQSSRLRKAGKLDYPLTLLPRPSFVAKLNLTTLLEDLPRLAVLRRVDLPEEQVFHRLGLRDDIIQDIFSPSKVPNMSLNLLGGGFQPTYIRYNPTGKATEDWDGRAYIFLLDYLGCIKSIDPQDCCAVYFPAKDLHDFRFPSTTVLDKNTRHLVEKLGLPQPLPDATSIKVPCHTDLVHVPTQLNYWHCQFTLSDPADPIDAAKGGYKRKAAEYARDHLLSVKAKRVIIDYDLLPAACYRKAG